MLNFNYVEFLEEEFVTRSLAILLSVLLGYLFGKIAGRALERALAPRLDKHQIMVFRRLAFYVILLLSTLTGLNEAGIDLKVLVGAAGVASVALGFASQTTMSNLISGIFMLIERPFMIGDTIKVGATIGEVSLIGLFSTTLKTPDNMMVRIPNEFLMKSEITNVTRYPTRKLELMVGVPYSVNMGELRQMLFLNLQDLTFIKKSPAPEVHFRSFGESSIQISVGVWVERERASEALTLLAEFLKETLDKSNIDIPVPQRDLNFPTQQPLRVEVVATSEN